MRCTIVEIDNGWLRLDVLQHGHPGVSVIIESGISKTAAAAAATTANLAAKLVLPPKKRGLLQKPEASS
jgi:hypothetical protein